MLLGEKISSLRKSKGISQELLAENSRVSLRTIQRIEAGTVTPRLFTLKTLATALAVPIEELSRTKNNNLESFQGFTKLKLINVAALVGIVIPLSNIVFTLILWRKFKELPLVADAGRRIVSFQLLWTLATVALVFFMPIVQYSIIGSFVIGRFPPTAFLIYVLMLAVNLLVIIHAATRLQAGDDGIYTFVPTLF
jgi:transcriptional regulator with XRE-family HTH domain